MKYFLTLFAFIGLFLHCSSQNNSNFSTIYNSNALFKMRKQLPNSVYANYACHFYVVTKAEEAYKNYPSVPKEEIIRVMKLLYPILTTQTILTN